MRRRVPSWVPPVCLTVGVLGALAAGLWVAYQLLVWWCALLVYALAGVVLISTVGTGAVPSPAPGPAVVEPFPMSSPAPHHPRTT